MYSATSHEKIDVTMGAFVVAMLIDLGSSANMIDKKICGQNLGKTRLSDVCQEEW